MKMTCSMEAETNELNRSINRNTLSVFLSQFVEDIGGIEACVIAELPGDDFQGSGNSTDQHLLLTSDGARHIAEVFRQFHFNGTSTCTIRNHQSLNKKVQQQL